MKKIIIASAVLLAFPAAAQAQNCYTVEKGDTPSEISNQLNVSLEEFFQGSGQTETIYPGETVDSPQQDEQQNNNDAAADNAKKDSSKEKDEDAAEDTTSEEPSAEPSAEQNTTAQSQEQTEQETANAEENNTADNEVQSESEFEQQVIELTNQEREAAGLDPLKPYSELSDVARDKAEDMRDAGYFSHNSPNYGSPFDMMDTYNIEYQSAGENIAAGQRTPEEVVEGWMNSEGHRENILNEDFTHIGVGHAEGGSYGDYWSQMFVTK